MVRYGIILQMLLKTVMVRRSRNLLVSVTGKAMTMDDQILPIREDGVMSQGGI